MAEQKTHEELAAEWNDLVSTRPHVVSATSERFVQRLRDFLEAVRAGSRQADNAPADASLDPARSAYGRQGDTSAPNAPPLRQADTTANPSPPPANPMNPPSQPMNSAQGQPDRDSSEGRGRELLRPDSNPYPPAPSDVRPPAYGS